MADDHPRTPFSTVAIAVITITITIGLAVLGAFYTLIDPRGDIKRLTDDLHSNYLTIREHNEFQVRVARDILRVEEENARQNQNAVTNGTFQAWKQERDGVIMSLQKRVDEAVSKNSADEIWRQRRAEIDDIQRRIEALAVRLHEHEREDRVLTTNGRGEKGREK